MFRGLRDRAGWIIVLAGAALTLAVQALAPVGVPLYDGVAIQEPYRFLHPPDGRPGSPASFSATLPVVDGTSPEVQAFTSENPPQVQLIMLADAVTLTPGATSVTVSLAPIEPPAVPPAGQIAGNVYRLTVTDQAGTPLSVRTCSGCISLVLRAPEGTGTARLQRFAGGVWTEIRTIHAGVLGQFATNPTAFGDYAVVTGGPGGTSGDEGGGLSLDNPTFLIVGGGLTVIVVLVLAAWLAMRAQRTPKASTSPARTRPRPKPPSNPPGSAEQ